VGDDLAMPTVQFANEAEYAFAAQFLEPPRDVMTGATLDPQHLCLTLTDPVLAKLLARVAEGQSVVLPFMAKGRGRDYWIITSGDKRELDAALTRVSRFIIPTYAEFGSVDGLPQLHLFSPKLNKLQELGAQLYPSGYYSWQSPIALRDQILQRLDLWLRLEAMRPPLQMERRPRYGDLLSAFNEALAAQAWIEAEECIAEMQKLNLSTADNVAFLRVQLLAQKQNWSAIWSLPDYKQLAQLRVPRSVRSALLSAVYFSELLPLEAELRWGTALDKYRELRPRLGRLLAARFGISHPPVVKVFAYEAAAGEDRTSLAALREASNSADVVSCLDALEALMSPVVFAPAPELALSPLVAVKVALALSNFDDALQKLDAVRETDTRALLLLEIAFHTGDVALAERALLAFWDLPPGQQKDLQSRDQHIAYYLDFLDTLVALPVPIPASSTPALAPIVVANWLEWFVAAESQPDHPGLQAALEGASSATEDAFWTPQNAATLSDKVLNFVSDRLLVSKPYARNAIQLLGEALLRDLEFPREPGQFGDLYETVYLGLLETGKRRSVTAMCILRFADDLLRRSPERRGEVYANLHGWLGEPLPVLENAMLEALELLAENGLQPGILIDWYRSWLSYLLALPTPRARANLETWLAFGEWIQPGADLLAKLRKQLEAVAEQDVDNPVTQLPAGFSISIFSLRESSAKRARTQLLTRNPNLDVRLCFEKDLNEQAKSLAQNSDMSVVVTTCVTHALTYGIGPYLRYEAVYPSSSGSTSIVCAIEDSLRKAEPKIA
jgi:hypothetical protein